MSVQVSNQTSVCDLSALAKHREMNRISLDSSSCYCTLTVKLSVVVYLSNDMSSLACILCPECQTDKLN